MTGFYVSYESSIFWSLSSPFIVVVQRDTLNRAFDEYELFGK